MKEGVKENFSIDIHKGGDDERQQEKFLKK